MRIVKTIKKEDVIFSNKKEDYFFSLPYFYEEGKRVSFDDDIGERIYIIVRNAYQYQKTSELYKGIRADTNTGVITALNFIVRYGIAYLLQENDEFIKQFYSSMEDLINDENGSVIFLAIYKGINIEKKYKRIKFPKWSDEMKKNAQRISNEIKKESNKENE